VSNPRLRPTSRSSAILLTALLCCAHASADWRVDGGYPQLQAELGAALPTGAGIVVLQSEVDFDPGAGVAYLPQTTSVTPWSGTGNYTGKTFTADSGLAAISSHSHSVAEYFYGNNSSVSPGVTDVHVMVADDYFYNLVGSSVPATLAGKVHNMSWVGGSTGSTPTDNYILRALDYMVNRDGITACTPLGNNTGALPVLLANSYNTISMGLRGGGHSTGGTTADGTGRMKPDLVVNVNLTSFAGPAVGSTAAMLRQAMLSSHPEADHPQVIKAILIAAASKTNLPGWFRADSTKPYHATLGAGELNMLNAWHILAKGQQAATSAAEVLRSGWDYTTAVTATPRRYFFTVPVGSWGGIFSAALTWHRTVNRVAGSYTTATPNLTLRLFAADGLALGAQLDQSSSAVDNVEHLFQRNLPAGQYALEVSITGANDIPYGLAWETQISPGPNASVRRDEAGNVHLDLANLDPFVTYTIQRSTTLAPTWSDMTTIRTATTAPATTRTWQDTTTPVPGAAFYRLRWTPIR